MNWENVLGRIKNTVGVEVGGKAQGLRGQGRRLTQEQGKEKGTPLHTQYSCSKIGTDRL